MVEIIIMDHTQILVVMFIIVQSIGVMELIKLLQIQINLQEIITQIQAITLMYMLEVITKIQVQINHQETITQIQTQTITLM